MEQLETDNLEPIAVVGIGCRFPGDATSPQALWNMLLRGESAWSEFPVDRVNISAYYHPSGTRQGSICFRGAHFLKQNVSTFDNAFFGVPADEAKAIDPQQRMLLEVTVEALDSAGIDRNAIRKSETGVWIGSFVKDYEQIVLRDCDDQPQYGATGNGTAIMSNRLSYFLDVSGPSMTIDTGCSASLVCVHQACKSLLTGESDMALAGGSGLILTPNTMMPMTALNFLSPDGKSYTFDSRANGYGRGEGVGIIVLKRLSDAVRDNDNIRAVIRNTRLNQDGRTPGITLPSTEAQIKNMRAIYERAGLDPTRTAFVECHGTGTQAGDIRELKALSQSICRGRTNDKPVYVGSIKTNIGHLEGAAGIAGLIKGILTVEHGIIPKHINFKAPGNPDIEFENWKVKVPLSNTPWPVKGLRRASVNSFGFGGTNAHAILDDAAHYLAERGICANHSTDIHEDIRDPSYSFQQAETLIDAIKNRRRRTVAHAGGLDVPPQDLNSHIFVFSANDQNSLLRILQNQANYILGRIDRITDDFLEDLAYTLGCRRTKMQWRVAITARTSQELATKLQAIGKADLIRTSEDKSPNVAFVFSGQGAQWFSMGRELLGFDIYSESIVGASKYMTETLGSKFSLLVELLKDKESSRIDLPEISQPATTAIQVALVDFLVHHCGVIPSSVVGHSSGEIAAAYASGMISRETAWELAYYRGLSAASLLQKIDGKSCMQGRMLVAGLSKTEAAAYLERIGRGRAVIACINSPASITLSGDDDAILEVQKLLNNDGIFSRLVAVNIAYHSHHMIHCAVEYRNSIAHLLPREPARNILKHPHATGRLLAESDLSLGASEPNPVPDSEETRFFSSVAGMEVEWHCLNQLYWMANLVSPVHFHDAVTAMMHRAGGKRPEVILEISPHAVLRSPLQQIFEDDSTIRKHPKYLSMLHRNADAIITSLEVIGELWSHGCDIAMPWVIMRSIQRRRPKVLTDLPNYPWNHETSHWHESHLSRANRLMPHGRYDLIGRPTLDSIPFQPRWRGFFRVKENPWITHHQVQMTTLYPAAGMISMVLEGAKQLAPGSTAGIEISRFRIEKAMLIPATDHGLEYALNMNIQTDFGTRTSQKLSYCQPMAAPPISYEFYIYSKLLDGAWQQHGSGIVTIYPKAGGSDRLTNGQSTGQDVSNFKSYHEQYLIAKDACKDFVIPRQLYETLDVIGMNYGPLFQNIISLHKGDNICTYVIRIPDTESVMPARFEYSHILHPATLDSVFQTAFSFDSEPMVPSYIGSMFVSLDPELPSGAGKEFVGYAKGEWQGLRETSVTYALSGESWKNSTLEEIQEPLVIIKDMRFTAISMSPDLGAVGFIPNHRNLCSEILWEPQTSVDTSIHLHATTDQSVNERSREMLLLIPEETNPTILRLCSYLSERFKCTTATLASIKHEQIHQSYCISLLEILPTNHFIWDWSQEAYMAFRELVNSTKGLLWLTWSTQLETSNPKAGLFQALARTIRSESPQKNLISLDIGPDTDLTARETIDTISNIFTSAFSENIQLETKETDFAERGGKLLVPRLVPIAQINRLIERGNAPVKPMLKSMAHYNGRLLKVKLGEIGNPETLHWDDDYESAQPLAADFITIKVLAAGLSVLDADIIMDDTQEDSLGTDVYGVVEALGESVQELQVGDRVLAITRGSLRQQVRCHRSLVQKVSNDLDASAVLLPTPLALAHYLLHTLAPIKNYHSVLVHAAASSFGQALIRLAQHIGATVFATVTNEKQRRILGHDFKIPDERIFYGDNDSLHQSIMRVTHDAGVNVIFDPNSEYRKLNRKCVANLGQIIRLAKKESVHSQAIHFTGKTFYMDTINLAYLINSEPWRLGESLEYFCLDGIMKWLPHCCSVPKAYDWVNLPQAFDSLMKDSEGTDMVYCIPSDATEVPIMPPHGHNVKERLRSGGTYVLAGQGGLAMHIARMLEANGVKNIALLSRSGAASEASKATVSFIKNRGVNLKVIKADICDREALDIALNEIQSSMPPIRGVFQCAAIVRDAVFDTMTHNNWRAAARPKTIGSWNLYELLPQSMDFFIFLSSSAGIIGNRGQANYAAGNAFQDALARHINHRGMTRSVSIDLGPVLGAGMLAEDPHTLDKLKATGFFSIRLQDFERVIERAITGSTEGEERTPSQIVMGVGTGGLIRQNKPIDPYWTRTALFKHLNRIDLPSGADGFDSGLPSIEETTKVLLTKAPSVEEAHHIITTGLCTVLAASIGKHGEELNEGLPPSAYGVDSLAAVSIRNYVHRECNVDVSVFEILSDYSISDLCTIIVERGGFGKAN